MNAVLDLGPEVRRAAARRGPGRVEMEWRPDPAAPARDVLGARSSGPHHRLMLGGRLTPWAFEAGERFAGYAAAQQVGRPPDPARVGSGGQRWSAAGEVAASRELARRRLEEARAVLGPTGALVVHLVCVEEQPLYRVFDAAFGGAGRLPSRPIRAAVVQGALVVALEALAARWRVAPRGIGGQG
jgi:hypothetical protein